MSGLSCAFIAIRHFTTFDTIAMTFIEAFLVIIVIIHHRGYLEKTVRKLLVMNNSSIESESLALKKVFALNYLMTKTKVSINTQESHGIQDLHFWGLWSSNFNKTAHSNVYSANPGPFRENYANTIQAMILDVLMSATQRLKQSYKLKMFLANSLAQENTNLVAGYGYLQEASRHKWSDQIIKTLLMDLYQQKVYETYQDTLNIKTFLEFETMSSTFIKMIHANSVRFIEFWKAYSRPHLEIKDLLRRSQKIEEEDIAIKRYWANSPHKDIFYPSSMRTLFSIYLSLVRNAVYTSSKLQETNRFTDLESKQISQGNRAITLETLASPNNILFEISLYRDKTEKIAATSSNILEKLGWTKYELTGRDMKVLFPRFAKRNDAPKLIDYHNVASKSLSRFNKNLDTYIRDRDGYVIPCCAYFSFHPDIQQELRYLAIIRTQDVYEEEIILDEEGHVQGFTRKIGKLLALPIEEALNVSDFCINTVNLGFLKQKVGRISPRKMNSTFNFSRNNSNSVTQEKSDITLSLMPMSSNEQDRIISEYRVTLTPFKYYDQRLFVLNFNAIDLESYFPLLTEQAQYNTIMIQSAQLDKVSPRHKTTRYRETDQDEDGILSIPSEGPLKESETVPFSVTSRDTKNLLGSSYQIITLRPEAKKQTVRTTENQEDAQSFKFLSEVSQRNIGAAEPIRPDVVINNQSSIYTDDVTSRASTKSSRNLRFEQAVYDIPRDNRMRFLNALFILLMITASTVLLVFRSENTKVMDVVTGNVEIAGATVTRLMRILNLYGMCRYIALLDLGKIFEDRYLYLGEPSLRNMTLPNFKTSSGLLVGANTRLLNILSQLDPSLSQSLFEKFPVVDFDEVTFEPTITREMNSFDLVTELGARVTRIGYKPKLYSQNDTDVMFITKNAVNGFLLQSEKGISIVVEDTLVKLRNLNQMILASTYSLAGFGLLLLAWFFYIIRVFLRDRERMLAVFKRLDYNEINEHSKTVERFCLFLMKYDMDIKRLSVQIKREDLKLNVTKSGQSQMRREKPTNMRGTNVGIIKVLFYLLALLVIVYSGYIITIIVMGSQNDTVKRKINLMVTADMHFYELYMLWTAQSQYIGETTNFTLRNKPVSEEFDRVFNDTENMNEDFMNVIDKEHGLGEDAALVELFTGNLCVVAASAYALKYGNPCYLHVGGLPTKGIIGVETYFRFKEQQMKSIYDNSMTNETAIGLLNERSFIEAQNINPSYLFPACDKANTQMQAQLKRDASKFADRITYIVIIYVIVYLGLVIPGWWWVRRIYLEERAKWRRMLRLVPLSLIESDKMLKGYLMSYSKGTIHFKKNPDLNSFI